MQKAGGVGRVQDCSDVNVTLGAGVDGYSITYDHASGKFVLSSVSGVGISKIQDADDVNFSLGAGVDGYTVNYDHDTGKFVLTAPVVPGPSGISDIQDADDVDVTLGAGVDEYALCYDHGTAKFVLRQIAGVYVALVGSAPYQSITNGLYITAHDSVDSCGLKVTQGWDGAEYTWQRIFAVYTRSGTEIFSCRGRGMEGAGLTLFMSANTIEAADSLGLRVMTSLSGVQALQCKSILVSGTYTTNMTVSAASTIYGSPGASGNLLLQSTMHATKGYILLHATGGNCGIGNSAPGTPLDINLPDAATNTVSNVLTVRHASSGTPAAGFGVALIFGLESSTTENQSAGRVYAVWSESTHATRKAQVVFTAYDTVEREGIRIGANGSAATLGLLGATPSAQLAHVADVKGDYAAGDLDSEAEVISMANAFAAAINSLNALVETFGLRASS